MKQVINLLLVISTIFLFNNCYDRGIIDSKDFNHFLPKVNDLDYTSQGKVITLTWKKPGKVPSDFKKPLEINIQKIEDNVYKDNITLTDDITSYDISVDIDKSCRFVVKLKGYLIDELVEQGKPERVYSEGAVIEIR